ncbi:MAG: BatD family protein [Polyangia bacterium]
MTRRACRCVPLLAVAIAAVFAAPAGAQKPTAVEPPQIGINVDREPLVAGQPFELTITISTRSSGEPQIRLPRFRGLRVIRQSESHPMSFSFSFGMGQNAQREMRRKSIYTFVLVAERSGRYEIDPVQVTVDGKTFQSDRRTLVVVDSGSPAPPPDAAAPAPAPTPEGSEPSLSGDELAGARVDSDYFVQLDVSDREATVGEMVVLTVYLYTSRRISDVEVSREPGTEGFWVETLLSGQRRLQFEPVTVDGRGYDRAVLRKLALFPIEPGTALIEPAIVEVEVRSGGFFSRSRSVKRSSPPVEIRVDPLPAAEQPEGFEPTNVGRYDFGVSIDHRQVEMGEPVTLTLSVTGEGNLRNVSLPEVQDLEGFKVYSPEHEVSLRPSRDTVAGTRRSKVLMIPEESGELKIPSVKFHYFDPAAGEYRTLTSKERRITVAPAKERSRASVAAAGDGAEDREIGSYERLNRKLRSIESRGELEIERASPLLVRPWFLALLVLAPLAYIGVVAISRARRRLTETRARNRSKHADARALRSLAELKREMQSLDPEEFYGGVQRALIRFLEDRLEAPVAGDTSAELEERLVRRGFAEEQAERVIDQMESCDFARFARSSGDLEERAEELAAAKELIRELGRVRIGPPGEDAG